MSTATAEKTKPELTMMEGQSLLWDDDKILEVSEQYASLKIRQATINEGLKTCKEGLIRHMLEHNRTECQVVLEDEEQLLFTIEEALKIKKVVTK